LRTDGLWADWGIHHAHLTEEDIEASAEFSPRSEWLIFFWVSPQKILLIDIRSHNQANVFQDSSLVEIAIRSFPQFADRFVAQGAIGLAKTPAVDPKSVKSLRGAGITRMLQVDGKVYLPPGMGVTTASIPTKASLARNRINTLARNIGKFFTEAASEPMAKCRAAGIPDPMFSLNVLSDGRLAVRCISSDLIWPFPTDGDPSDARRQLQELIFPAWAHDRLTAYLNEKPSESEEVGTT
jgi:hypothetical protein